MESTGQNRALAYLIERLTDRRTSEPSSDSLRKLKRACKTGGDATVISTFGLLMEKIKEDHAKVQLAWPLNLCSRTHCYQRVRPMIRSCGQFCRSCISLRRCCSADSLTCTGPHH